MSWVSNRSTSLMFLQCVPTIYILYADIDLVKGGYFVNIFLISPRKHML